MRTPGIALWALACLGLSPALAAPLDDVDRPATVLLITAAELADLRAAVEGIARYA